jgi:excisionase family DNA binding protein
MILPQKDQADELHRTCATQAADVTDQTVVTSNQAAALALVFTHPKSQRGRMSQCERRAMNSATTLSGRALYTVPEAMEMLNLSRTVIYEQIRSGRLLTVTQGRRRLVPASSMTAYVDLLVAEAMARTNAHTP